MLTAICNQCGKEADFELVCEFEGDLVLTFLKCPECEAKYLVAVMDSDLIRDIETFASMKKNRHRAGNGTLYSGCSESVPGDSAPDEGAKGSVFEPG